MLSQELSCRDWGHPRSKYEKLWDDPWIFDRCRETQFDGEGKVKVWARGHGKSVIGTFGNGLRMALADPDRTLAIFSITNRNAQLFLLQIKTEIESNSRLHELFHDRLWVESDGQGGWVGRWGQAPKWSVRDGLTLRRSSNPRNATIEAHGLVDGVYTGSRFTHLIYDDIIDQRTVTTTDQIDKAIRGFSLSQACVVESEELGLPKVHISGTFYSKADPYIHLIKERGMPYSIEPCYAVDSESIEFDEETRLPKKMEYDFDRPVFFSEEQIQGWRVRLGAEFGIQMLCDPVAGLEAGFDEEWIRYFLSTPWQERKGKTVYILVDPANSKKKDSSYTAMWVIGVGGDRNYYVLDGVRRKMSLPERTDALFDLVQTWRPFEVRYEQYGIHADIDHVEWEMERRNYRFNIEPVKGFTKKEDRIRRLVPLFKSGRVFFPNDGIDCEDEEGKTFNLVSRFIREEYRDFPQSSTMDLLDAMSRIVEPEMPVVFPRPKAEGYYDGLTEKLMRPPERRGTWMSA